MKLATTLRLAALLAALSIGPALADSSSVPPTDSSSSAASTVPDELQGMVGDWLLAQEDQSLPTCPMTLSDQQVTGGWAVTFPETCEATYPVGKIVIWNVDNTDGSVLLLDAERHVALHLFEDEDGLFDTADNAAGPKFYMLPPDDADGNGGEDDAAD